MLQLPLFYNHKLLVESKNLYDRGFRFVKDIHNQHGEFLDLYYLEQTTYTKINLLQYQSLKLAIRKYICTLKMVYIMYSTLPQVVI